MRKALTRSHRSILSGTTKTPLSRVGAFSYLRVQQPTPGGHVNVIDVDDAVTVETPVEGAIAMGVPEKPSLA